MNKTGLDPREDRLLARLKTLEKKWVALVENEVVASDEDVTEVRRKAETEGYGNYVLYLVPSTAGSLAPTHS